MRKVCNHNEGTAVWVSEASAEKIKEDEENQSRVRRQEEDKYGEISKLKEEMKKSQNELIAENSKLKEEMEKSQNDYIAEISKNKKLNEKIAKIETKKRWKVNLFSCCIDSDI